MTTRPPDGLDGQLLRLKHHRFLCIAGNGDVLVAVGVYDLEHGWFQVTHPLGREPPRVGERFTLSYGIRPQFHLIIVVITDTANNPDNDDRATHAYQRERP